MTAHETVRSKGIGVILAATVTLALIAGCSTPKSAYQPHAAGQGLFQAPPSDSQTGPTHDVNDATAAPYLRVVSQDTNEVALQVAVREFIPPRKGAPRICLVGVSHIGDSNYFAQVQETLSRYPLVLYEGISASGHAPEPGVKPAEAPTDKSLQTSMAKALGLAFQLEAIDYSRSNFVNSDLSTRELLAILSRSQQPQTNRAADNFKDLMSAMNEDSAYSAAATFILRMIGSSRGLQALGRLTLIEILGQLKGDPSTLRNVPPDMLELMQVLIQERNARVIRDLKVALGRQNPPKAVAVFYGAAHMPDLEEQIRRNLRYQPAGEVWLTPFSVDLRSSGVSQSQREFISSIVSSQLKQFQSAE